MHSAVTRCREYSNRRATPPISCKLLIWIIEFQEARKRHGVLNPTTCRGAVRKSKTPLSERRQQPQPESRAVIARQSGDPIKCAKSEISDFAVGRPVIDSSLR